MARRYCFTLNNFTEPEQAAAHAFLAEEDKVTYGVVGREVGDSGTPHLQGFVILTRPQRISFLRRRLSDRAHYEVAKGTSEQASVYCKKDGDYREFGSFPGNSGRRTDVDAFIEWGSNFILEHGRAPTSPELALEHPHYYLRFPRAVNLFTRLAPPPIMINEPEPNEWQTALDAELGTDANPRTVKFIIDPVGGKGKTWFQQWQLLKRPDDVQVLGVGKRDDMCYMVDSSKTIFLLNVPRSQIGTLQYSVLEMLKDRIVHSHKYRSTTKYISCVPHVVVFTNEHPDMHALSEDRYDNVEI